MCSVSSREAISLGGNTEARRGDAVIPATQFEAYTALWCFPSPRGYEYTPVTVKTAPNTMNCVETSHGFVHVRELVGVE